MELRRWDEMPMDCLVSIFSKLGLDDRTIAVPLVCKSWYQASLDPLFFRIIDSRYLDFDRWISFLDLRFENDIRLIPSFPYSGLLKLALARARGTTVYLGFEVCCLPSHEELYSALDKCPKLKILILPYIESEDEEQFLKTICKWKDLEVLEMESKPSVLHEMVKQISLHCKKFQGLKLKGSINEEDVGVIIGSLPKLKWLDLSFCWLCRDYLLDIIDGCRYLKRLNVRNCIGFKADEELKRRASGIEVFEHEGSCTFEEVYELAESEDDWNESLEDEGSRIEDVIEIEDDWNESFEHEGSRIEDVSDLDEIEDDWNESS